MPNQTRLAIPIGLGAAATLLAALVYLFGLADLRQAANHPQLEMVHTAVSKLDAGGSPQSVVPADTIDIASSADPFLIVVDGNGTVLAASASVGGSTIIPPSGVFDYVRDHGEDVISWQPADGVRSAIVVDSFHGGYVVGGRSLNETEREESFLQIGVTVGWVVAILALVLIFRRRASRLS